jgi:hypothetical protein
MQLLAKERLVLKNRILNYTLLGLIILLFFLYFTAQNIVFPSGQPIVDQLNNIIAYAEQEKWPEAEKAANELISSWDKSKYLLAINYAEEDYSLFIDNLSRIQGAIRTRDDTETVSQALSALKLWDNFIKVIPQP